MIFQYLKEPFEHLLIENFFTDKELEKVWSELYQIKETKGFDEAEKTHPSRTADGKIRTTRDGIFLDKVYRDFRESSYIYIFSKKIYFVLSSLPRTIFLEQTIYTKSDSTLISVYKDKDYYLPHRDTALATFIIYLWKEKAFEGGELVFPEYNYKFTPKTNSCILFPSVCLHEVPIINKKEGMDPDFLRVSISTFINIS